MPVLCLHVRPCGSGAACKRPCLGGRAWPPCGLASSTPPAEEKRRLTSSCLPRPCRHDSVMRTFLLAAMVAMAHGQAEGKPKEAHPICRPVAPPRTRIQNRRRTIQGCSISSMSPLANARSRAVCRAVCRSVCRAVCTEADCVVSISGSPTPPTQSTAGSKESVCHSFSFLARQQLGDLTHQGAGSDIWSTVNQSRWARHAYTS